jgi:formylglycine-generating enzyme required for sulfatase activity
VADASSVEHLVTRWFVARQEGQDLSAEDLCAEHPELLEELKRRLSVAASMQASLACSQLDASVGDEPWETTLRGAGAPSSTLPLGKAPSLAGYEILGELGRGGMGVVYKARQSKLDRLVALKMVLAGGHAAPEQFARFRIEAEAIARLQHTNIVQIFEVGEHDGLPFFSMELCPGGSLAQRLTTSTLPAADAARLVELLARGMHEAHRHNVVHRDLKPANILLAGGGPDDPLPGLTPKVTDFGLARKLDDASQTQTGAVLGTPSYMAPEQAEGQTRRHGPAVDVHALGAILYECLTGRPPFKAATTVETLLQVMHNEPVPPRQLNPKVPVDLETICLKCLHKEPHRRYDTALALAEDLERFRRGEPVTARPANLLERALKWGRRRPTAAALLGVSVLAVLGLVVLSVVAVWQWQRAIEALAKQDQERAERALAQVDTLLTADPRAVPAALENLKRQQDEVLTRLRQVWDQPSTSLARPQRMRAALALLPVEPALVREALVKWMLEVPDPAELLAVRNALQPHAAELRGELWRQLSQPELEPQKRIRLLAALAGFDPHGAGWSKIDEQSLEPWLTDNPLYLGAWTEAFGPAREHLLAPLTRVFRGPLPERRIAAASILIDYAKNKPQTLVELVVEADDRQFAVLLPALQRQRQQALPLLRRQLDRRAEPAWDDPPLKPSWSLPSAPLRREVKKAQGLLTERFALVQTLPLERFEPLAEELQRSGYRPVRFRPYVAGRDVHVAAVWRRDGRDWKLLQGVSAQRVRQHDEDLRKRGFQPVDACGWLAPAQPGEERYAALWVRARDKEEARLYVGVPRAQHEKDGWGPLRKAGLDPLAFHAFEASDGTRRCCSVWTRLSLAREGALWFWLDEPDYEAKLTPDQVQMEVQVRPAAPPQGPLELARAELQLRDQQVNANSKNVVTLYYRGVAHSRLGDDKRALADLDAFLKAEKRYSRPFADRALVLARLGRTEAALQDLDPFRRAVAPADYLPVEALVALYLRREVPWPALEQLVKKEADPDPDVLFNVAVVHAQAAHWGRLRTLAAPAVLVGLGNPLLLPVLSDFRPRGWHGHQDRAVALLERSLAAGLSPWSGARDDLRLAPLHDHAGYRVLLGRSHPEREYSSIWHPSNGALESIEAHGLTPEAHLTQCRELGEQGYRPAALSVAETKGGLPLVTASVWQRPGVSEVVREVLARRQSSAALALMKLGQTEPIWPFLQDSPYPETQSRLTLRMGPAGVSARLLVERLEAETDVSARRALILALGEYREVQVPSPLRQRLLPVLRKWYRDDPDAGIHGAIDWLLRHDKEGPEQRPLDWRQATEVKQFDDSQAARVRAGRAAAVAGQVAVLSGGSVPVLAALAPWWPRLGQEASPGQTWYVNGQKQTLAVIDGRAPFLMGSPGGEAGSTSYDKFLWRQIGRRYALGTTPVTVAQFQRFQKAHPEIGHHFVREHSPEEDGPIIRVTWHEAAQYCRWLSEQEGFPEHEMVYPPVAVIQKSKDGSTPLRLPVNYLKRRGYRLPTEAEWELACRAGVRTSRYYGSSLDLLPRYAWYNANAQDRTWPVGQKRPNALGLFDMHGNVWNWCQEGYRDYPAGARERPFRDLEDTRAITLDLPRGVRGGMFYGLHRWRGQGGAPTARRPTATTGRAFAWRGRATDRPALTTPQPPGRAAPGAAPVR